MSSPSILSVLRLIKQRPMMYLGGDERSRRQQLHSLQDLLTGYKPALSQHGVGYDLGVLAKLEGFLRQGSGADNFTGIDQILATSANDQDAWDTVWTFIDEFETVTSAEGD